MKLYSANETAAIWGITVSLVRRYCREGKVINAVQTEQGWMIPEGTPKPGTDMIRETPQTKLVKKLLYQRERNQHFGLYEYMQVNLAYSSCRMASNRLTRDQVQEIYRTKRITPGFEPTKVADVVEIMNHFIAMRYITDNITQPLTISMVKQIHYLLTYGTYADQNHKTGVGEFRMKPSTGRISFSPPLEIGKKLGNLIKDYERKDATLEQILDFHVYFERIHPFDDYNGRVGRILMMKECLRYGIDPFIIDDKRRGAYNRGIKQWDTNLTAAVLEAQKRFQGKMEVCRLMEYHRPPKD